MTRREAILSVLAVLLAPLAELFKREPKAEAYFGTWHETEFLDWTPKTATEASMYDKWSRGCKVDLDYMVSVQRNYWASKKRQLDLYEQKFR